MTQHGNRNDLPQQLALKESEFFDGCPRSHFDGSLNGNSGNLDLPDWSFDLGYVRKTGAKTSIAVIWHIALRNADPVHRLGDLRSFSQDENSGHNSLPARFEQPGIISNCGLEDPNPGHVTFKPKLGSQTALQDRMPGSVVTEQDAVKAGDKAPNGNLNFREIVFDTAANASTLHVREISSAKGRTGPMSPNSRSRMKLVKDAGGACWRCKFVGKGCDAGDPCSSCPRKATPWHAVGCRRGTLWDVLTCVILCPQAGEQSGSTPGEHPKRTISIAKEHGTIANLANTYLPLSQSGCTSSLSRLLSSAARYQSTVANVSLILEPGIIIDTD